MSVIIFVPKLLVIVFDNVVGRLSDAWNTPIGRRRPFLLIGALVAPPALAMLFHSPQGSDTLKTVYTTVGFALVLLTTSVFSVPYLCLGAEMSPSSLQRTRLLSTRMIFLALAIVTGIGANQALIKLFGGGAHGYAMLGLILAAVCFVSMLACFFGTRGARTEIAPRQIYRLSEQVSIVAGNRPFIILSAFHFIQVLAAASNSTAFLFYMIYVIGRPLVLLPMTIAGALMIIAAQPFWVWLAKKTGSRNAYTVALVGWASVCLSWSFAWRSGGVLVTIPLIGDLGWQDVALILRYLLAGLFNSGVTLLSVVMLTDTMAFDRERSGAPREGAFGGAWSALEKIALASGPLWVGPFLLLFHFRHGVGANIVQGPDAIWGIKLAASVLPAALCLLTLPLIALYSIGSQPLIDDQTADAPR
jgi:GPH family glycoside/pentoside/hexuronide:cation symporter